MLTKKRKAAPIISPVDATAMTLARPRPSRDLCLDALRSGALLIPPLARQVFDCYGTVDIYSTNSAFAAIMPNGCVLTWEWLLGVAIAALCKQN